MNQRALEVIEGTVASVGPTVLFQGDGPRGIVAQATATAQALAPVLENQKLYTNIQGRKHVRVEGWTLLGTMLGVFPICAWSRPTADGSGWEARVEARTLTGALVGAAEAQCTRGEKMWSQREDFALRSMAQTRATSKALRLPLGFVVTLAGYDATPAEEMDAVDVEARPVTLRPTAAAKPVQKGATPALVDAAFLRELVTLGADAGLSPKQIDAYCKQTFADVGRAN